MTVYSTGGPVDDVARTNQLSLLESLTPGHRSATGIEYDFRPHVADTPQEWKSITVSQGWAIGAGHAGDIASAVWFDEQQARKSERREQHVNRAARILCFLSAVACLVFGFYIVGQGGNFPPVTVVLAELALMVGGGVFVALIFALTGN